jgi:hypothetical protein
MLFRKLVKGDCFKLPDALSLSRATFCNWNNISEGGHMK